jgi:hypothetical protein
MWGVMDNSSEEAGLVTALPTTDLHMTVRGRGAPLLLIHGSLTPQPEW